MVVVPKGVAELDPKGDAALVAAGALETADELVSVLPKTEPLLAPPNMLDPPPNALEVDVVDAMLPPKTLAVVVEDVTTAPKTLAAVVAVVEPPNALDDVDLAAAAPPNTLAGVVAVDEPPKTPEVRDKSVSRYTGRPLQNRKNIVYL